MRTTEKQLMSLIKLLNETLGHKTECYTKVGDRYEPNPNVYHLEHNICGYKLAQMCETGTGTKDVLHGSTKAELWDRIHAYLRGIEAGRKGSK